MSGQPDCEALKSNDPKAIEQLYRFCYGYITGFLIHREKAAPEAAADACADAVLLFVRLVQTEKVDCRNPRAYILKTAINTIRQSRRSAAKNTVSLMGDAFMELFSGKLPEASYVPQEEEEEQLNMQSMVSAFEQAWQKISDRCRELLTKKIYDGMKNADLATAFQLKSNDVVVQAVAQCKESLKKAVSR